MVALLKALILFFNLVKCFYVCVHWKYIFPGYFKAFLLQLLKFLLIYEEECKCYSNILSFFLSFINQEKLFLFLSKNIFFIF